MNPPIPRNAARAVAAALLCVPAAVPFMAATPTFAAPGDRNDPANYAPVLDIDSTLLDTQLHPNVTLAEAVNLQRVITNWSSLDPAQQSLLRIERITVWLQDGTSASYATPSELLASGLTTNNLASTGTALSYSIAYSTYRMQQSNPLASVSFSRAPITATIAADAPLEVTIDELLALADVPSDLAAHGGAYQIADVPGVITYLGNGRYRLERPAALPATVTVQAAPAGMMDIWGPPLPGASAPGALSSCEIRTWDTSMSSVSFQIANGAWTTDTFEHCEPFTLQLQFEAPTPVPSSTSSPVLPPATTPTSTPESTPVPASSAPASASTLANTGTDFSPVPAIAGASAAVAGAALLAARRRTSQR